MKYHTRMKIRILRLLSQIENQEVTAEVAHYKVTHWLIAYSVREDVIYQVYFEVMVNFLGTGSIPLIQEFLDCWRDKREKEKALKAAS